MAVLGFLFDVFVAYAVISLVISVFHTYATYIAWAVTRTRNEDDEPESIGQSEVVKFFLLVLNESLLTAFMLLVCPVGYVLPVPKEGKPTDDQRPILLVHGFTMNWSNFLVLWWRLRNRGFTSIHVANLGPMFAPIEVHVEVLSARIDRILAATGASTVDVIAHSMGGIVTRSLMAADEEARRDRRVERLITLATPHQGTQLAELGLGPSGQQMRRGSDFLASLPPPPPGRVVSISSDTDNVVFPCECAQVGPPGEDIVVPELGHFGLLTSPTVARHIFEVLEVGVLPTIVSTPPHEAPEEVPFVADASEVASTADEDDDEAEETAEPLSDDVEPDAADDVSQADDGDTADTEDSAGQGGESVHVDEAGEFGDEDEAGEADDLGEADDVGEGDDVGAADQLNEPEAADPSDRVDEADDTEEADEPEAADEVEEPSAKTDTASDDSEGEPSAGASGDGAPSDDEAPDAQKGLAAAATGFSPS